MKLRTLAGLLCIGVAQIAAVGPDRQYLTVDIWTPQEIRMCTNAVHAQDAASHCLALYALQSHSRWRSVPCRDSATEFSF